MRVIVCGGRDYADRDAIEAELRSLPPDAVIVHGGAQGADNLAGAVARSLGLRAEVHPAEWGRYGKAAGPRRNAEMLAAGADLVLAFPGGKGTADMVAKARAAGVPLRRAGMSRDGRTDRPVPKAWGLVPAMRCKGLCQDACGPIDASRAERELLSERGVDLPDAATALQAWLASGGKYTCPALVKGRCTAYDVRPTICRLWGAVEGMPCPHGCVPARGRLSDAQARAILVMGAHERGKT